MHFQKKCWILCWFNYSWRFCKDVLLLRLMVCWSWWCWWSYWWCWRKYSWQRCPKMFCYRSWHPFEPESPFCILELYKKIHADTTPLNQMFCNKTRSRSFLSELISHLEGQKGVAVYAIIDIWSNAVQLFVHWHWSSKYSLSMHNAITTTMKMTIMITQWERSRHNKQGCVLWERHLVEASQRPDTVSLGEMTSLSSDDDHCADD